MYSEKNNKIDIKAETKDYENRYRFYATENLIDKNIINLDIFYKHNPSCTKPLIKLEDFNHFYKPFENIDWNNTEKIEWLKDCKYDINFLKERDENCYHYKYYIDKETYNTIQQLKEIGFVPIVWKLPKYVADIIQLQKEEQTKEVKKELSNCRKKLPMLYLAFTPLYCDENFLRFKGLAQISKYVMLHDLVYAIKKTGFTDLQNICKYLTERKQKNKIYTSKNARVIDHHTKIERRYNLCFSRKVFSYKATEHLKHLYSNISSAWCIENQDMPSANNLASNLFELDSKINSRVKNKILDRNICMYSNIIDSKTQVITVFLQEFYVVPKTNDSTNVVEILFHLSNKIEESSSKNIISLYNALEEVKKEEKTEGDFLYQYAQKNGLDLRYRAFERYDKDEYFLLWLNKVPLFNSPFDTDNVVTIKNI